MKFCHICLNEPPELKEYDKLTLCAECIVKVEERVKELDEMDAKKE
jgi:hypothetical protein